VNPTLEVQDLSVTVTGEPRPLTIIDRVSFKVPARKTIGLVGESGSGKSLLCKALVRLLPASSQVTGRVWFTPPGGHPVDLVTLQEQELRGIRGRQIGFLFQEPSRTMNPVLRCGEQVLDALPRDAEHARGSQKQRVNALLTLAGIEQPDRVSRAFPHELSGGMLQRVALACALAGEPTLLIADEPTAALDAVKRMQLLETLEALQQRLNLTLILVSHDLRMIARRSDEILVMYAGQIVEMGVTGKVLAAPAHPYTQALLQVERSFLSDDGPATIPGDVPDPDRPPPGCRFHPRCALAEARCATEEPAWNPARHGGRVCCHFPLSES
jgi:oligopeptide/dipeptide ABC transporter ATP-binding protein